MFYRLLFVRLVNLSKSIEIHVKFGRAVFVERGLRNEDAGYATHLHGIIAHPPVSFPSSKIAKETNRKLREARMKF